MGFFKKLLGTAAVTGAAVGGAWYVKKRKDERTTSTEFEDFDDLKIFNVNKDSDSEGNPKVTITFNSHKAKKAADVAADKVIDATEKVKSTVAEKLGEDNVNSVKDKVDFAKDKINDATAFAKDKAKDAKDIVVEKVGEENIQAVKEKVSDAVDSAKEKVSDTVDKIINVTNDFEDFSEDDFEDEDIEPDSVTPQAANTKDDSIESDGVSPDAADTEDDVNLESDDENDDFLSDELDEL